MLHILLLRLQKVTYNDLNNANTQKTGKYFHSHEKQYPHIAFKIFNIPLGSKVSLSSIWKNLWIYEHFKNKNIDDQIKNI